MSTKKTDSTVKTEQNEPKVYGWIAGVPAYLQVHPNNKPKQQEETAN